MKKEKSPSYLSWFVFPFFVVLLGIKITPLLAQEKSPQDASIRATLEQHNFEWVSPDTINTALDGYPKFKIRVTNKGSTQSPDRFGVSFISEDYDGIIGGFANFPNGGSIKLEPGESMIVGIWSQGVRERAVDDKNEDGSFTRDIGFKFLVDDFNNKQEIIVRKEITFIDWNRPIMLNQIFGSFEIKGTIPADNNTSTLPNNQPRETKVYVRTPNSELIQVAVGPSDRDLVFAAKIIPRDDWYLVVDQPSYLRSQTKITDSNAQNIVIERTDLGPILPKYSLKNVIDTPTGFWRGSVSESEETFVLFPGQENWMRDLNQDSAIFKQASTVFKYSFDGNLRWKHQADWEIWGGDMTKDGSKVAYVVNPSPGPKDHKLVVLDGATGEIYWELKTSSSEAFTPVGRTLESLALELSDDGKYLAVGTTASGLVTLFDVENKEALWSYPDNTFSYTTGFGQIREMRFSPDNEFLYIGAGDSYLTKLRLSDRKVVWRSYTGAWPFVNGMNFSPDKRYIYTGTKSFDLTKTDIETGETMWQVEPQFFDAEVSRDGKMVATFGGKVYDTESGSYLGTGGDRTHILEGGKFMIGVNKEVTTYDIAGKAWYTSEQSGIANCGGCQVQWSYLSNNERYLIVAARDMTGSAPIPGPGIAFFERNEGTYLSSENQSEIPNTLVLNQNYPNPFNPTTLISFNLPYDGRVALDLYNLLGQRIERVYNGTLSAGKHNIPVNAGNLSSGLYFYTLTFEEYQLTRKMMLLK